MLNNQIVSLIHLGARAFDEIGGEVVQTCTFTIRKSENISNYRGIYKRLTAYVGEKEKEIAFGA